MTKGGKYQYSPKRTLVLQLRHEHPDWTLAAIGREVGLSRERVRQILTNRSPRTPNKSEQIADYLKRGGYGSDMEVAHELNAARSLVVLVRNNLGLPCHYRRRRNSSNL